MYLHDPYSGPFLYVAYAHLGLVFRPEAQRVLVVGLGGGSIPKRFWRDYPAMLIEVAELDPMVVDVAKRFFGVPEDLRLRIVAQDGRLFLRNTRQRYDMIILDAYFAESIPFHLTTREFMQLARLRLAPGGIVLSNVIGALQGPRSRLFRAMYRTMGEVFPGLYPFPTAYRPSADVDVIRNIIVVASGERGLSSEEILRSAIVQGQAVRVRVRTAAPASAIMLRVDGRAVPLHRSAGGYQAFVGTSPLTKPGALRVKAAISGQAGVATAQARVVVRAGTFGIRRLTVPPALLDPALVERERRRVAAATARPLPAPLWRSPFRRPVEGPVTSGYGVRSIYNGVPRGYHLGVDFRASAGTPVRAAHRGLVTLAEELPLSGKTVVLDHGAGIFTTYQHLSAITVRPGRRVNRGDVVGRVGSTGLSTGPHLHWGMRVHGVRVNPLDWTAAGALTTP